MVIYLAGPMAGKPNQNREAFAAWAKYLRDQGHSVYNPGEFDPINKSIVSVPHAPNDITNKIILRQLFAHDLDYICRVADTLALLPGWELSYGARAEQAVAVALGHKIIYLREEELQSLASCQLESSG